MSKWDDANHLAANAPQEALSGPISQLRNVREDVFATEVPACAFQFKQAMLTAMDALINGYLSLESSGDGRALQQAVPLMNQAANELQKVLGKPTLAAMPTAALFSSAPTTARPTATATPRNVDRLALLSASCKQTAGSFFECDGSVKNLSDRAIQNLEVVISWVDATGTTQRADQALINFNPVLAGQESAWKTIGSYNPALTRFRVEFKDLLGGTISYRDDRPTQP